ncbi:MAG: HD domain-containing protein, partial [Candidatus Thermoplasmatota archaeon]|nr:HD domain-containing protein [Candidatus Thermoplasmatota archaeon]
IRHLVEGARIAKELGLPDSIIRIIERHIGAGLPAEDARKLGLPEKNYMPETLEEKIVCHSDNLIDDGEKQHIENEVEKVLAKGLDDYARRLVALHKELSDICGVDVNNI